MRKSYGALVMELVLHLAGSALLFIVIFVLAWLLSYFVHWLLGIHTMEPEAVAFLRKAELGALYLDTGLVAVTITTGTLRFCRQLFRLNSRLPPFYE